MTDLDWDTLRVFLATVRAETLRGAAENLGVTHATVRRAIGALESALQTRLFDRHDRGLNLTDAGRALVAHAEEMERQSAEIARKLTGLEDQPSGTVRVSLPPSLSLEFIAPIVASFAKKYPDIEVHLIPTNRVSDLARAEADVSIRAAHRVEDNVVGRRLLTYTITAFAAPAYLERYPGLADQDPTGTSWIGYDHDHSWVTETPFPTAPVRHILPEVYTQIAAAAEGVGMIWIPTFLGDVDRRIVRIPGVKPVPNRSLWLLLHGDLRQTARVRAFVDHTADYVLRNRAAFI